MPTFTYAETKEVGEVVVTQTATMVCQTDITYNVIQRFIGNCKTAFNNEEGETTNDK